MSKKVSRGQHHQHVAAPRERSSPFEEPKISRRVLLAHMAAGATSLAVNSACGPISLARARVQGLRLRFLTDEEGQTLETLGDVLLPGAAEAGIAHYVDTQLGSPDPLLFLKYVDWTGEYTAFYRESLASLERSSRERNGKSFRRASPAEKVALVTDLSQTSPPGWIGPPSPLFYFVTRNDAVDVFYGTQEGLERLAVPYMPHILPPRKW